MAPVTLTSIDQEPVDLTTVRTGRNRKWKVVALILAIICLVVITVIIFMAYNRNGPYDQDDEPIITTTEITMSTIMDTTPNSIDEDITPIKITSNRGTTISTTVKITNPVIFTPAVISQFTGYEKSFGLSLNHSLYYNANHYSTIKGYVTSVTLRLFTNWEGDHPLYLFAIESGYLDHPITHRYPLIPERNNTEWQTIEIPFRKFPIFTQNHLAIGMQDTTNTNQIYAVRSTFSLNGVNITSGTDIVLSAAVTNWFYGVAFTYTAFEDGEAEIVAPPNRR